jgi:hypothetical protein
MPGETTRSRNSSAARRDVRRAPNAYAMSAWTPEPSTRTGEFCNHPGDFCHHPGHFVRNQKPAKPMKSRQSRCNHSGHATPRSRLKCPRFAINRPARAPGHGVRAASDRIRGKAPRRPACHVVGCPTRHYRASRLRSGHRRSKPAQVFALNILPRRKRDASG